MLIHLKDVDNRSEDGEPFEFTDDVERAIAYIDGPVREDAIDPYGLGEAIDALRKGKVGLADDWLSLRFGVYVKEVG